MTTTPQGHVESLDLSDVIDAATAEQQIGRAHV